MVFETLTPSTEGTDRFEKNWEYRDAPSIQRYVMLEQSRCAATVYARGTDGWAGQVLPAQAALPLSEVGVTLQLADIYEGVTFASPGDADAA